MTLTTADMLWVPGEPKPKGSVRAFVPTYKDGTPVRLPNGSIRVNVTEDNAGTRAWAKVVRQHALEVWQTPFEGVSLEVRLAFYLGRPKSHFGSGRNSDRVLPSAPAEPVGEHSGDVDKLARAMLDALTGVAWTTDACVTSLVALKFFADGQRPGCSVWVSRRGTLL